MFLGFHGAHESVTTVHNTGLTAHSTLAYMYNYKVYILKINGDDAVVLNRAAASCLGRDLLHAGPRFFTHHISLAYTHVTSAFKYRGTPPPHHHFCGRAGGAQEDTFHFGFHFRLNLFRVSSVYVVNFDVRVRALSFSCSLYFELFASI